MIDKKKCQYIFTELYHHLPFSTFGVLTALLMMGVLTFIAELAHAHNITHPSEELFHVFHPAHVFLSAMVSTAMFIKHDGSILKGCLIGFFGSLLLCTLSDAIFPFVGGKLLGAQMGFHIDLIEHPELIIPFAVIGTISGLAAPRSFERATEFSHSIHVFVSSVASILYLLAFGLEHWTHQVSGVFLVTIIAVMIPCCLSDIVLPLACSHKHCSEEDDASIKCCH